MDQTTIDKIKELSAEMKSLLDTYTNTAKEMAAGLKMPVNGIEDIDRLEKLYAEKTKEAAAVAKELNRVMSEQSKVMNETTPVLSRRLMEQERINKSQREAYTEHDRVKRLLEQFHDTYDGQLQRLVKIDNELSQNKEAQKAKAKALREGKMGLDDYARSQMQLTAESRQLKQEKSQLTQIMAAEEKAGMSASDSYAHMSQQLELLKKAYKQLSAEDRTTEYGQELESTIQDLNAHLIDLGANMGEFQRNIGNYAIAGQNGVVATESLMAALEKEARTQQDVIDQTKILEEAKLMLDKRDSSYESTLAAVNAKLDENKKKIMDVSDIMGKMPGTVAEAEAQNKRLAEALKLVDVNAVGAEETIKAYRDRIESNNEMIQRVTGSNEEYADSLLSIIGINGDFGRSFESLANSGGHSFIDGLNTKVKALGKTLLGLLANPWVLALLGISGVAAGFKWWYDYNKGLVEATKKTKDFTGLAGGELKAVRNEVQAVADQFGKDFTEVLEGANAVSRQFGISFQEAMKLVEDGFLAGADVNGEFIDNIKEYPAYFREAGISASEFIAITTQANQAGIYSDKGIDVIKEGNLRIREMTKSTREALEGIGISSQQVQQELADGSKTTFDIMQEVSAKLAEFPETSTEVGTALADIFGGPGEDAGLQYILTLKDIDTNLDNVKARGGELVELQEEQLRSQIELNNVISSVFDHTGGSFETMTTKAKVFVNDGIIAIIKGCVDVVNWFVKLYNKSVAVRFGLNMIVNSFKAIWTVAKFVISQTIDGFKSLGDIIEGVLTINPGKIKAGYQRGLAALKDNFVGLVKELKQNADAAVKEVLEGEMQEVSLGSTETDNDGTSDGNPQGRKGYKPKPTAEEAEKAAKEQLKIQLALEDAKIAAMEEGHEKELALIRQNFKKKIAEITGDSQTEKDLRLQLAIEMADEIGDCELKYQQELSKINLENRLACVEEGSKEELDLRLAQLEAQRAAEIEAAEKTGADVSLIQEKYNKKRQEMTETYAGTQVQKAQDAFAMESAIADNAYNRQLNRLNAKYAEELQAAGNNGAAREEITRKHEDAVARLTETYAIQRANASVAMLEEILKNDDLSAKDRAQLEDDLAKAKIASEKAVTDATIAENERKVRDDNEATEKRIANAQRWLQVASDSLNAINDLASAVYDAKIERVEEEQEMNTEAGEREQERISELVEKNVITEEEGEARKRAAETKTAKKNEELERKKQQLKHKQAVWDKANSIAQIGISTALAIMNASQMKPYIPVGVAASIAAGALGAVQLATAMATPIPKYAKGTKDHPGGPAIVGDGGRHEVVLFNGTAWVTPDIPTLVDIPQGAAVLPEIKPIITDMPSAASYIESRRTPKYPVYDDSRLRSEVRELAGLFRQLIKTQKAVASHNDYELFKRMKI